MELKQIGFMLRNKRLILERSIRWVAEKSDISHTYLAKIENNNTKNVPTEKVLRKLAEILEFKSDETEELLRLADLGRTPERIKKELNQYREIIEKISDLVIEGR